MVFYILLPDETESDTIRDDRKLGEVTWKGKFKKDEGFKLLSQLVNAGSPLIVGEKIRIIDSTSKKYSIEQFMDFIENYHIY